ncbi:heterokaryon incompatibility protein-domain-containing protein [Boeremia exigua]|uniref:heterokaryon incompatibility protein-domain-containing protein n=1 Tax=Boeremia exigua TaxID=749465 RepID=UPI001E8D0A5B|nr:heterokaryon incompatibility protein-domain-containing protein [Boeremia exigua]KAH6644714.1 heterokaryon incompatibility protein-domain-containing protein [Boeremia exigua]
MDESLSTSAPDVSPYTPIDQPSEEIRLLTLEAGAFDDELVINLRMKRLDKKRPAYEALSYVWGKEVSPHRAVLNGRYVTIGRNLDCALRHLRQINTELFPGETFLFWVDALCINQADFVERAKQVQLMDKIYASAKDVSIWLGPERQDDLFLLNSIGRQRVPQEIDDVLVLLKALKRLCRRPWFGRLWIAQELALSDNPKLLLGHRFIRWHRFFRFVDKIFYKADLVVEGYSVEWPYQACFYFTNAASRVMRLHLIKNNARGTLTEQLGETSPLLASDPRDKVFGLLSICRFSSHRETIKADYTKTVSEVFAEATFSMLQEGKRPGYAWFQLQPVLQRGVAPAKLPTRAPDLPTWALDFTIGCQYSNCRKDLQYICKPSILIPSRWRYFIDGTKVSKLPPPFKRSSDPAELSTFGKFIGTIYQTTGDLFDSKGFDTLSPVVLNVAFHDIIKPRNISARSFLQALVIDRDLPTENYAEFEDLLSVQLHKHDAPLWPTWPATYTLNQYLVHKDQVVFVTAEKHVGMAYHPEFGDGIRPGDIVVGLFGINYPVILRAVEQGHGGRPLYNMINTAHVAHHKWGHDFVENAPPKARWRDFREFGLEEYTII